jgi:hypothetical protein
LTAQENAGITMFPRIDIPGNSVGRRVCRRLKVPSARSDPAFPSMVKPGLTRSALTGDKDGNAGDSAFGANRRIEKVTGFGNLVRPVTGSGGNDAATYIRHAG